MKFKVSNFYFLLPIVIVSLQAIYTFNSNSQIRFAELEESVEDVWYFANGLVVDGIHVNVGWYALLNLLYPIFGFSLNLGKIVYLVATFISASLLCVILKRFFNLKSSSLILLTIYLSPTLLYMHTLNIMWAMTLHLLIAVIYLLSKLELVKEKMIWIYETGLFLLMMVWWFFYQTVVFYLPSLLIYYFGSRNKYGMTMKWSHLFVSAAAFLLPLVALFSFIKNKEILIYDPDWGSGMFRGGGGFVPSDNIFAKSFANLVNDFFIKGVSWHFEPYLAEFSLIFPIITLVFMVWFLIKYSPIASKMSKALLRLGLTVIAFNLLLFSTTSDFGMPGMKRVTPTLAAIYFLWILAWFHLRGEGKVILSVHLGGVSKVWGRGILGLLLLHHLIVYPINLAHLNDPSPFKELAWFGNNPQQDLEKYLSEVRKQDLLLDCRPILEQFGSCNYRFIYTAVASACKWNGLECHKIKGWSSLDEDYVELSIDNLKYLN